MSLGDYWGPLGPAAAAVVSYGDASADEYGYAWTYDADWANAISLAAGGVAASGPALTQVSFAPPQRGHWDATVPQEWGLSLVTNDSGSGEGDLPAPNTTVQQPQINASIVIPPPIISAEMLTEEPSILGPDLLPDNTQDPAWMLTTPTS